MTRKVWTAEELERLSPAERSSLFASSIEWDLDEVPPSFLDRVRARVEDRIDQDDTHAPR